MKPQNLKMYGCQLLLTYRVYFIGLFVLAVGAGFLTISVEYKIKEIIDAISLDDGTALGALVLLFAAYKTAFHGMFFLRRLLALRYMPRLLESTVVHIYQQTVEHSLHWFDSQLSGEISNKIFDFQKGITALVQAFFNIVYTLVTIIIAVVFLTQINYTPALVLVLFILVYLPVLYFLLQYQLKLYQNTTSARQKVVGVVNDSIANIFGVKVIGNLATEFQQKLQPSIRSWRDAHRKALFSDAIFIDSIDTVLVVLMSAVQIYVVAYLFQADSITAGDFAFIAIVTLNIHKALEGLLDLVLFNINPSLAEIKSSYDALGVPVDVVDAPTAKALKNVQGKIEFRNVDFAYGDRSTKVLQQFNLEVKPGERLGIVGTSGAGKTTLIKCLLRYFDTQQGAVLIDDQAITNVTQRSLRENIAIIPQDISMFHRSIQANLRLAKPDATDAEIIHACQIAKIHDDIIKMPHKYETIVGERGVKLSGGQRQRIAIARAILKQSPIIILDEATSSLDSATEQLIQGSIQTLLNTSKASVIAIAHRLSTLKTMDRIIVMDKGTIIEAGTHTELLAKAGFYKELWDMQLA